MTRRRAKQPLTEGDSVTLPKSQQRAVIALVAQREQIKSEANRALAEIGDALTELAKFYATKAGLPGDVRYDFETQGQAVVLVRWKDDEPEEKKHGD